MKISTRGRYGLKAMVDIAANSGNNTCVCLKSIAERTNISDNYLEQLIAPLKRAGLVKSIRGAQGGYILGKDANDISVGDILRAVEGPMDLVECLSNTDACGSGNCECCTTKSVWHKLSESVNEAADSIALSELISK
jgi:Rrf2 family protein